MSHSKSFAQFGLRTDFAFEARIIFFWLGTHNYLVNGLWLMGKWQAINSGSKNLISLQLQMKILKLKPAFLDGSGSGQQGREWAGWGEFAV